MQTHNLYTFKKHIASIGLVLSVAGVFCYHYVFADSASDIQAKIDENNQKIADLEKQIEQYSTLLNSTSKQAQTLQTALANLELTQKKLQANLALTSQNISKTNITLSQLKSQISATESKIDSSSEALSESMRQMDQAESQSAIEKFFANKSISDAWDYINNTYTLQTKLKSKYEDLKDLHESLTAKENQAAGEKDKLVSYQKTLSDQQQVVAVTKQEKDKLLTDTKNQAATYNKILAEKTAQKAAYEQELFDFESQLKSVSSTITIPSPRFGILSWPISPVSITQYFGKTVSAQRLYVSGTHGGIDFRASIGTPIKAAMSGTVSDTEPTKYKSGCQYGKYVLISHPDGLSTIYGHLSVVSVKPGDTVTTGQVVGYSGDTGYATGPHLHFGLYITSDIRIVDSAALVKPPAVSNCAGIKTVAAPQTSYLDPSAYLPKL